MRKLVIAYWLLLTAALLVRDPWSWLPGEEETSAAFSWLEPGVHFLAFLSLAFVAFSVRWPIARRWLVLWLVLYAAATEVVQGFVGRRPELVDFCQDLLGIVAGAAVVWLVQRKSKLSPPTPFPPIEDADELQTPRHR